MRTLLLCLLLAAGPAAAQVTTRPDTAPEALPQWVVPVLRLVSETHVEPTTGVVLSSSGLVLVPDDFAAIGDEIVVLDGGNDIVRNGRPARLHSAYPELGLEVLMVPGLSRNGAPLAAATPADGDTLRLQAFPPAEQIVEGAIPVRQSATVALLAENGTPSVAAATPLPNVTGPLLDACGHLAGVSLADGVQTMAPSAGTQYRWRGALQQVMEALELPSRGVPCGTTALSTEPAPAEPALAEAPAPAATGPEEEATESEPEAYEEPAVVEEAAPPEWPFGELPPHEDGTAGVDEVPAASGGEDAPARSWWWLAGGLLLVAAGLAVHRARQANGSGALPAITTGAGDPGSTTEGGAGGTGAEDLFPGARPDSRVVLRGRHADGRSLEVSAGVSAHAINLEIGRGAADLVIDSPAVSRRHARLNGTHAELTIADLGSSNGTSIDGVPCLEGEIMYLEPDSTVILGDVRFTVSVEPNPSESAGS